MGNLKIAAERAMYWNGRGGGHDSIGYMYDVSEMNTPAGASLP